MNLPEGSTWTKMSLPLPSEQRRPMLKWVCHSTLVYIPTLKFIPPEPREICFEQKKCITRLDYVL